MLLRICQVTSDNIPVGSSFLPLLTVVSFREFARLALVTVLRVPLSLNSEDGKWARSKVNASFTSASVQTETRRWNIRSESIEELTVLTE